MVIEFVTGVAPSRVAERQIQTIVFTDIVDSVATGIALGNLAWRDILDSHDRIAWRVIEEHHGSIVKSTGDGLLARFDSPANAIQFAVDLRRQLTAPLGLRIRCGVHSGEVELRDDDISGAAVNLAAELSTSPPTGRSSSHPRCAISSSAAQPGSRTAANTPSKASIGHGTSSSSSEKRKGAPPERRHFQLTRAEHAIAWIHPVTNEQGAPLSWRSPLSLARATGSRAVAQWLPAGGGRVPTSASG